MKEQPTMLMKTKDRLRPGGLWEAPFRPSGGDILPGDCATLRVPASERRPAGLCPGRQQAWTAASVRVSYLEGKGV